MSKRASRGKAAGNETVATPARKKASRGKKAPKKKAGKSQSRPKKRAGKKVAKKVAKGKIVRKAPKKAGKKKAARGAKPKNAGRGGARKKAVRGADKKKAAQKKAARKQAAAEKKAARKQAAAEKKRRLAEKKAAAKQKAALKKAAAKQRAALKKAAAKQKAVAAREARKKQRLAAKEVAAKKRARAKAKRAEQIARARENRIREREQRALERVASKERKAAERVAAKQRRASERAASKERKAAERVAAKERRAAARVAAKAQKAADRQAAKEQRAAERLAEKERRAEEKRREAEELAAAKLAAEQAAAAEAAAARRAALVVVRRRNTAPQVADRPRNKNGAQFLPQGERVPVEKDTGLALRQAEEQLGLALSQPQRRIAKAILAGRDVLVTGRNDESLRNSWLVAAVAAPRVVLMSSGNLGELRACHEFLSLHGVVSRLVDGPASSSQPVGDDCQVVLGLPASLVDLAAACEASGTSLRASRILVLQAQRLSCESPDYSPAYERLRELLENMQAPPIAVSMQPSVSNTRDETLRTLGLRNPSQFVLGTTWSNLQVEIIPARGEVKQRIVERVLRQLERPTVMFCATPEDVDDVYEMLADSDEEIHRYHQEMSPGQRAAEQLQFLLSDEAVMIATSAFDKITLDETNAQRAVAFGADDVPVAFGAGIKKANIRSIVHYQAPLSLEQYAQELELAGMDGEPAKAVMFFDPADPELSEARLDDAKIDAFQLNTFGNNLMALAAQGDTFDWAELVEASPLAERVLQRFVQLALEHGALTRGESTFRVTVPAMTLPSVVRGLAKNFGRHQLSDRERLAAMSTFARQRSCIVRALRSTFGTGPKADCGVCGHCNPRAWLALSSSASAAPAQTAAPDSPRRGTIHDDVSGTDRAEIGSYHTGRRGFPRREISN